jgi:hypothetical protein
MKKELLTIETIDQYALYIKKEFKFVKNKKQRELLYEVAYASFLDGIRFRRGELKVEV